MAIIGPRAESMPMTTEVSIPGRESAESGRLAPGGHGDDGIVITCGGPLNAGGTGTVTIVPLDGERDIEVSIELNGIELPKFSKSVGEDGTITITFPVPAGGAGGAVSVTASGGGSGATTAVPVAGTP